ncbi:hypothetical protein NQ314_019944 [Rhamnusium bicolor]|uniref:CAP-Gly domain-containing protein n=1 Tax=Rhamnusium bicolor TaxID=1586634 RepID=A0AAV8WLG5_9CUCU|nr:hypothetical protein NQ314_019944 [Rhamnusium bicolor]
MDHGEGKGPGLETVRALHQTVVALRAALEESKSEILELKSKAWPIESVQESLRALSIENHVLRRKLLDSDLEKSDKAIETENAIAEYEKNYCRDTELVKGSSDNINIKSPVEDIHELEEDIQNINHNLNQLQKNKKVTIISPKPSPKRIQRNLEAKISIKTETISPRKITRSLESLTIIKSPLESSKRLSFSKTFSFSNLSSHISREFNFDINEQVKMSDSNENLTGPTENDLAEESSVTEEPQSPQNDLDQTEEVDDIELIFTTDDTKDSDFKEQLVSIDAGESAQEASNLLQLPLSEIEQNLDASDRELDDDVFNDNFENENQENANFHSYDMKRENSQLYDSKSDNSINQEKSLKSYYSLQDSSFENKSLEKDESFDRFDDRVRIVETDISKCGIHDIDYTAGRRNTCPNPIQEALSKGLTVGRKSRPILTHSNAIRKESGAQTDISALPGSSWRSESSLANKARLDHLFPPCLKPAGPVPAYGQFLRTTDLYSPGCTSQKFTWANTASQSDGSQTQSRYSSMYPLSSPPAPSRRCSAPVSPSRKGIIKTAPSKVKFANGSLPELRGDWMLTVDSGDSTDSLVEEAENYLRRSIDCIMTGRDIVASSYSDVKSSVPRRASAPEPSRDNVPPPGWQPFLPRISRDLKPDHWVKVITPEGRVRGGRVRHVGPVVTQTEQFVGVQLSNPDGYCDGTYNNRRYFQ